MHSHISVLLLCCCDPEEAEEAEEARIRGLRLNQPSDSTRNQNGIILHMREEKKSFLG